MREKVSTDTMKRKSTQSRARYLSAHDRRFVLLRATLKLCAKIPSDRLTPADVCREAHCVRSLFYRYFTDMPDCVKQLTSNLVEASVWDYQQWQKEGSDQRITPRSTLDSVSKLFVQFAYRIRPLFAAGNSGIVLDYIDGCEKNISAHLLGDFIDGVNSGHRMTAEGLEQTWGVFFTGLLLQLAQREEMQQEDVRILLARAFHIEALLNAW